MFGQELGLGFAEDARIEKDALAHRSATNGGAVNTADKTEPEGADSNHATLNPTTDSVRANDSLAETVTLLA